MKNSLKAVGAAVGYFALYLSIQAGIALLYLVSFLALAYYRLPMDLWERQPLQILQKLLAGLPEAIYEDQWLLLFGSSIATVITFWLLFVIRNKKFLREIQAVRFRFVGICPLLLFGMGLNIVISLCFSLFPFPESWRYAYEESSSVFAGDGSVLLFLTTTFAAPIAEEVTFRGLLYTRMKRGIPRAAAAGLVSLIFGVMHGTIIWALYTFIIGLILVWVFEQFQSLYASIILHMAFNATGMIFSCINEISASTFGLFVLLSILFVAVSVLWIRRLARAKIK